MARKKRRGYIAPERKDVYDKLKKRYGKRRAAQIANAGTTHAKRSAMARRGAATRRRRARRR